MEVHHPHLKQEKKKLAEYFFEFLMIFLAVTLSFIAENIRESISDHKKEVEYIKSFIEDLKSDTAQINDLLELYRRKNLSLDTAFAEIKNPATLAHPDKLYHHALPALQLMWFEAADRTMRQLENAGGLRLIRNEAASNVILDYSFQVKIISDQQEGIKKRHDELSSIGVQIFDANQVDEFDIFDRTLLSKPKKKFLLTKDPEKINTFF